MNLFWVVDSSEEILTLNAVTRKRSGEGNGTPLQYSCLENPMDGEAWWAAVHGVARSRTRLRDFTFTFHFHTLEKEMATLATVLAWRIPGTGEPGGLPSMGSHGRTRLTRLSSSSSKRRETWGRINSTDESKVKGRRDSGWRPTSSLRVVRDQLT